MKILLVTTHLEIGGLGVYTVSLAQGLKERGHEVHVASRGGALCERLKALEIAHHTITIGTKSELNWRMPFAYTSVRYLIAEHTIDVVHAQTRVAQVVSYIASRCAGIGYVATAHGFFRHNIGRKLLPCWGDATIAISDQVRDHLVNDFEVMPDKVRIVYNGVDVEKFTEVPDDGQLNAFRSRLDIGSTSIIGTVARLSSVKGLGYLIRAMKYLEKDKPELRLLIAGSGPEKAHLEALIKELNLEQKVRIIDAVVETYYAFGLMKVFILASTQEGLGLSLLEAMASGVPVVATDVGGVRSVVRHEANGLIVQPRDPQAIAEAVLRLLDNQQLGKRLAAEARRTINERFTIAHMVKQTEAVYRAVIAQRLPGRDLEEH